LQHIASVSIVYDGTRARKLPEATSEYSQGIASKSLVQAKFPRSA